MPRLNRFEWHKAVMQVRSLNATAKVVAGALAVQFANDETGQLNPGLTTLIEYLGLSLSTLKRAIKDLTDAGWLSRTEGRGAGNCTNYTFLAPCKIIPFRPSKKGSKASLSAKKKGSQVVQKGSTHEPSYKEQSKEQKARPSPSPDLPHEGQPGEALRLAKLTWVNLQNARLRNATILGLEKQHLANFKDWYDRPLRRRLERLSAARAQDHRDLYARFQDERADLIARQKVERGELQSQWRRTERRNDRGLQQGTRRQRAKEKAVAKDQGAAAERSLQDESSAQSKAKDALEGLRSPRPSAAKRKTQDRER
ncbi:hypothetical protein So717_38570 [Roseobacter cerasinus]|uniref:Helix-turn-helix domain-containing protein n=2 Tax=Roseobacter cerasinus TaxID=2602289 RepID=A0A640VWW9_9RHOB|nr:hypothetical protein So717_38570 [Roseobacter cerasinus]